MRNLPIQEHRWSWGQGRMRVNLRVQRLVWNGVISVVSVKPELTVFPRHSCWDSVCGQRSSQLFLVHSYYLRFF